MKYELNFNNVRKNGDLLFESIRGSHLFGLATENSDIDTFGLFCCPKEYLYDTRRNYQSTILSDKNDDSWYELEKFIIGLGKSNPNYLEAIFTPKRWIKQYDKVLDPLWEIRDSLLTKSSFKSFGNYAHSQISKAKGLNKAMNTNPDEVKTRKSVLDFCYVPEGQGTKKVEDWLRDRGLKQKYCGLVALPNMHDSYGLYYDFGTHLICEYGADLKNKTNLSEVWDKLCKEEDEFVYINDNVQSFTDSLEDYCFTSAFRSYLEQLKDIEPFGFTGIISETSDSNEPRVCTVPKYLNPLITMNYNKTGYESHCSDYKRFWGWVENRNAERYELNKGQCFDSKNISTCIRLMTEAKEIAQGNGLILDRTNIDRAFLLDVKNHKIPYEEIMEYVENLRTEMELAFKESTIPDAPDLDLLDDILIEIRKKHYKSKNLINRFKSCFTNNLKFKI